MIIKSKVRNTRLPGDVEEAYLFAKAMAKLEKEADTGTFWMSIVNIFAQQLSAVQHGESIF